MLNQDSSRPLYEQLKQSLIRDIEAEVYRHGERLPSELLLAERYGISRITVRRAIAELSGEGYISSQQGKGTYVNFVKGQYRHLSFGGFTDIGMDFSQSHSSRILAKDIVAAGPTIGAYLGIEQDSKLVRLHRLMSDGGKPYMIDTAFFRLDLYPDIFDLLADNISTFKLLRERYGMKFAMAKKSLGVVRAGIEEASLLGCVPGDPLISTSKIIHDRDNVPMHYSHYFVLGDRCVYTLVVTSEMEDMQVHFTDSNPSESVRARE
jgi:GntR family frlABCD operon transcriptional regulator